ncbi:MAG: accessory factor UbiK family protein [Betaproteobacteria bacterium]|nr:accessory factor UbiK family protein [Betaproteobacteria bacterium]
MTSPLESLSEGLRALAARSPLADVEHNVRAMVAQALSRLDLVSRAEFDAQARVLARTREKLAALEARVASLESAGGRESD